MEIMSFSHYSMMKLVRILAHWRGWILLDLNYLRMISWISSFKNDL